MSSDDQTSSGGPVTRHDLLERVREVENVFIPMADGARLAARLFLPIDADARPCPVILEYIPYRKRDFMRARDERVHRYFAAHGYAVARVDVRGSGDSDGVLTDEYTAAEHDDGVAVIDWLARQSFCDGAVGMMGISWGGFNALQIAARRPPALRAIITVCASDDRYADDAHYMGGCLLNENMQWGSILTAYNAMPPDPLIVGDSWRATWQARLEAAEAFPALWMSHPWRDEYWRHGSVCEDYAAIRCPVYAIGGWADGYSNAVFRLLAGLSGPRKGLIGPWGHTFAHRGYPGPAIGFLQEALRWWDRWLRDDPGERDIMDEPMLRAWMQDSVAPAPQYDERPGRWVAERAWPSQRIVTRRLHLNRGSRLGEKPEPGGVAKVRSPQITGAVSGEWCGFGAPGEMPLDQRPDDGRSLCFDSEPLEAPLEILGAPRVELELASDKPVALVAVRLCEVAPGGASTRVSYGLLQLSHRRGHAAPEPLQPGEQQRVVVQLNDIAHAFSAGNRLRLAISTAYWPMCWPSPEATTLSVWPGESALLLPERPRDDDGDAALVPFARAEEAPGVAHEPLRAHPFRRSVERDLVNDEVTYTLTSDGGEFGDHSHARLEELDLMLGYAIVKRHRVRPRDPLSARTAVEQWIELGRDGWHVRIECDTSLSSEPHFLRFEASLRAHLDGSTIFERRWDRRIPRELS